MHLTDKQQEIYKQCKFLSEANNPNLHKTFLDGIFGKITLDMENKTFKISRINFNKFILRVKEMYKSKGLNNLFDRKYSAWSEMLWEKEKISKEKMKIVELSVPLFFAIEIYKIFLDIADFYDLHWYREVSKKIYRQTWISNYESRGNIVTNLSPLSKLQFEPLDYQLEFIKQYETLKHIYDLEGYILSFDQGLGKTFTAIGLSEVLPNKDQIIIVCPNSLCENWAYEIRSYFRKYSINEALWKQSIYIANKPEFQVAKNPRYLIVNQENIKAIFPIVKKNKETMIIVDESHNFRNTDSIRTTELLKLKAYTNCKDNLLMSGTPLKATPDELIPALRMIDPYFTEELAKKYKSAFTSNSVEISRIVKERFSRTIWRRTKKEVLKLPERHLENLYFNLPNENEYYLEKIRMDIAREFDKIYKEKLKDLYIYQNEFNRLVRFYSHAPKKETEQYLNYINANVDPSEINIEVHEKRLQYYNEFLKTYVYPYVNIPSDKERLEFLAKQYIHMTQVAMGIALGKILPPVRTKCFLDLWKVNYKAILKMIENCPKKTIIFTQFLGVADYISNDLTKLGYKNVKIVGSTKNRMELIEQFRKDDETDILIATTQTLSTGVTLTEASQMFFFGTPYRSADFNQACDRIHRIGQTIDVFIYNVLLKSQKKNITDRINEILEWSGEMFTSIIEE